MERNLSNPERLVSTVAGAALATAGARSPWSPFARSSAALVGGLLVGRGLLGWCPVTARVAQRDAAGERGPTPRHGAVTDLPVCSDDAVDLASEDSFPASDPPSYTGSIAAPGSIPPAAVKEVRGG